MKMSGQYKDTFWKVDTLIYANIFGEMQHAGIKRVKT